MNNNILNINQKKQQNNEHIVNNNMPEICQTDNSLKLKIINVRSLATPSPTRSPIKSSQLQLAAASSSSSLSALSTNRSLELTKNDLNFCNKIFGIAKVNATPTEENYDNDIEIEEIDDVEIIEGDVSSRREPYKKSDRSKVTKNNRAKRKFDRSELAKYAKFYNQIKSIGKTKPNENIGANATALTNNTATDRTDMMINTASSPIIFSSITTSASAAAAAMNKQNRRKPVHQPLNDEIIVEPSVTIPKHLHATRYSIRKTKEILNPGKKITEDKKYKERMATVLSVKTTNSDAMTHLAFLRVCANVIMQEFGKPQIKFSKNRSLEYLLKKFYQRK